MPGFFPQSGDLSLQSQSSTGLGAFKEIGKGRLTDLEVAGGDKVASDDTSLL